MFKEKKWVSFLLIAVFAWGCHSSSNLEVPKVKMVKMNLKDEPHTLDPRLARDTSSLTLMRMLFEGLTRIASNEQPELALASDVHISEDLKTYVFSLREAKWSNGVPVQASDFVYSWRKVLDPMYHADNASQLYILKNGKKVKEGALSLEMLGVIAIDDQTLKVELEHPTPYFLEVLAFPIFFPVNQSVDEQFPNWAQKTDHYVSSGPFILKQWRHHDLIIAEKNPIYWDRDQVKIDGVELVMVQEDTEMKLFEMKELHWAGSPLSTISIDALSYLKKTGKLHVQSIAGTAFIRANLETEALFHPKVRKALALAIDRAAIAEHVTQGGQVPATGLVPPSMHLCEAPYFADGAKEEAGRLFDEALMELQLTRQEYPKITMTYVAAERTHLIAQAIQQQWNEVLGMRVQLEAIERKVYFDRVARQDYELALGSWLADFNDPVNFLEVFKYKTQSTNNTHWEDFQYQEMLDDSAKAIDSKNRHQILARCEKILIDAMPIIPLFHYTMLYLKDDALDGVFLSSLGNLDFKWATLDNAE